MCIWPDDASCVSKYGKSASSGVSLMSHQSINTQTIKIADGMKNTAHVASTGFVLEAKMAFSQSCNQPPVAPALVILTIACPQSNAK